MNLSQIIFSGPLITYPYFIIAYAILGGGIKYVDDAFDEKTFKKTHAIFVAPLLGILWAFTMTLSPDSATILAAIILSVFLRGKIDNLAHQIGAISIIGVLFILGLVQFLWVPLIVIAIAGIVDEIGNDFVDAGKFKKRFVEQFFEYRFVMKLAVFAFAFLNMIGWVYFFAFLAFDVAYAIVMWYSDNLKHKRKFYYHPMNNNIFRKEI